MTKKIVIAIVGIFALAVVTALAWLWPSESVSELPYNLPMQAFVEIDVDFEHRWNEEESHPQVGAAAIDIDSDGKMEVMIGGGEGQADVLLSYADGSLRDIIADKGLSHHSATYGICSVDLNSDGQTDLLVARKAGLFLYFQHNAVFKGRQIALDIPRDAVPVGITVADIDQDGDGDLYVSLVTKKSLYVKGNFNDSRRIQTNMLLLNDGAMNFSDISQSAGLGKAHNAIHSTFVDLNEDRYQDLVIVQSAGEIAVYRNLGNQRFESVPLPSGPGHWQSMAFGDIDRDGDQDLLFSNTGTSVPALFLENDLESSQTPNTAWLLLRNNKDFSFDDVTASYGLDDLGFGRGLCFEDLNLDGGLDLLAAQNDIEWPMHHISKLPGKALLQIPPKGNARFCEAEQLGLANRNYGQTPVIADLDGDGRNDVLWVNIGGPARALLNKSKGNFVTVSMPDKVANLGTTVTVYTDQGVSFTKEVVAAGGSGADQTTELMFGLAADAEVDRVVLIPLNGQFSYFDKPKLNSKLRVD